MNRAWGTDEEITRNRKRFMRPFMVAAFILLAVSIAGRLAVSGSDRFWGVLAILGWLLYLAGIIGSAWRYPKPLHR